jgi:hypothetical protein
MQSDKRWLMQSDKGKLGYVKAGIHSETVKVVYLGGC